MAATVTVTGTAGAGVVLTAKVFTDVKWVRFGCDTEIPSDTNILTLGLANGQVMNVDISAATTITATKTGSTYTFTIS